MNRENLLFGIIGLLFGFIVGFMLAGSMSQKPAVVSAGPGGTQNLPSDHPPIGDSSGQGNPQAIFTQVQQSIEKARKEPKNFDAQVKAAELFYQIQRYDQAIEFLLKANELQPTDYQTVVNLGMVNLDAGHYDTAEKWYNAAMKIKSDDVQVLSGLAASTLQQGDAKAAEDAIAKLEKVDPNSQDLPQFRDKLAALKSGKK
jgi:tetratricopeptide (TPR) repeat protein